MKIKLIGSLTMLFFIAGCASEWVQSDTLEAVWPYLEKENVQRIAFYEGIDVSAKPEEWNGLWAEIVEPEKINEVLGLLHKAMEKEKSRFADGGSVIGHADRMQIITDKHKFIIPIGCGSREDEAILGLGWTSCKLRKKLTDWGYAKPVSEKKYKRLECVLENLEEENVQRIAFYRGVDREKVGPYGLTYPSKEWHLWGEIIEPLKINEVVKLLREALKRGEDKIDEEGKTYSKVRIQIVTDKQKYIMPIFLDREAVYGAGWTSDKLREQLRKWGFDESKDVNTAPAEQ